MILPSLDHYPIRQIHAIFIRNLNELHMHTYTFILRKRPVHLIHFFYMHTIPTTSSDGACCLSVDVSTTARMVRAESISHPKSTRLINWHNYVNARAESGNVKLYRRLNNRLIENILRVRLEFVLIKIS